MFCQQIVPVVSVKLPPGGMNVVGIVLRICVFEHERRPLDAIIVPFPLFEATRPGKMDLVPSFLGDVGQIRLRDLGS